MTKQPDLTAYAAAQKRRTGPRAYCDTLPDDIQEQILRSEHVTTTVVCRWLRSLGYEDATVAKISHWRRTRTQSTQES